MITHPWLEDNSRNIRLYADRLRLYGSDYRTLGWGSRESQTIRFGVLSQVGKLHGASVLDVGCGLGDLCGWLRKKKVRARYTGIDITQQLVEKARERFPGARFLVCDLLDVSQPMVSHDFVLSSGIFTHRSASPFEFLTEMVRRMFELSKRAAAFNCLSGWAQDKEPREFHADPLEVISFCRKLTSRVVLRHDYHPRDFTIYLYKTDRA